MDKWHFRGRETTSHGLILDCQILAKVWGRGKLECLLKSVLNEFYGIEVVIFTSQEVSYYGNATKTKELWLHLGI